MDIKQYERCCAWFKQISAAQDIAEYSRDDALTLLSAVASSMLFYQQGSGHPVFSAVAEALIEAQMEIHWECIDLRPQIVAACAAMWAPQLAVASTSAAPEATTPAAPQPTVPASSPSQPELELPPHIMLEPASTEPHELAPPAAASASPAIGILVPSSAVAIPTFSEKIVPFSDDVISHASPIIMGGGHRLGSMIGDLGLAALAFIPILSVIVLGAHTSAALIGSMHRLMMPVISAPPVCFDPGG